MYPSMGSFKKDKLVNIKMSISYILLFVDKIFPYVYTLIRIGLSGPLSLLGQVPMSGPLDLVLMGQF